MSVLRAQPSGLTRLETAHLRGLVARHTGVQLEPDHDGLLEARLATYLRPRRELDVHALVAETRVAPDGVQAREFAEALVNSETSFFRDPLLFAELRAWVLPELIAREARLELWCAACSTGQEPYSLALLIASSFPELLEPGRLRITASDVSRHNLAYAGEAAYTRAELNRGLPAPMLVRWFERVPSTVGGRERWRLDRAVRNLVELRQLNLLEPWELLPPMDLVLLRNVMLYWSAAARAQVLLRLPSQLAAHGYLAVGGAEMISPATSLIAVQRRRWRFFQRRPGAHDDVRDPSF